MIDAIVVGKPHELGGFTVRRALPTAKCRRVGPFVFFDHMGPVSFAAGDGITVRPHPHIGLATVTYLFEGEIVHRDSLGTLQPIRPGDVNWMVAGHGIAHSERTSDENRRLGQRLHGIQSWFALPQSHEEDAPSFQHHPAHTLPSLERDGVLLDVIAGSAFGKQAPVNVHSPTLYVHARLDAGARLTLDSEHQERAVYVVEGAITCEGQSVEAGSLVSLHPGGDVEIICTSRARLMLLGGAKLDGERHLDWNFVSSSKERLQQARDDWRAQRFPKIPGDDVEFIPLP